MPALGTAGLATMLFAAASEEAGDARGFCARDADERRDGVNRGARV